jgi:hypothetical protein
MTATAKLTLPFGVRQDRQTETGIYCKAQTVKELFRSAQTETFRFRLCRKGKAKVKRQKVKFRKMVLPFAFFNLLAGLLSCL